jgi:type II secretory pathway component PulK
MRSLSRTYCSGRRRGAALIAVLWVSIVAGLILLGVGRELRVHVAMAQNGLASVQAHWLARAGVETALAALEDDGVASDSAADFWYDDELAFQDVELGNGTFSVTAPAARAEWPARPRYGLIDHGARVNLNLADARQLKSLADLSESQIAAVLDWRDGDDTVRSGGAEQGYYEYAPHPYKIRNGPFQTPRELLLVRGMDLELYFGEDCNENGLLDRSEDDEEASFPPDNADGRLDPGLAGLTTVFSYELNADALGLPRLNVNTASKADLTSKLDLTDALAEAVVKRRKSKPFGRLMELLEVKAQSGRGPGGGPRGGDGGKGDSQKVKEFTLTWLAEHLDDLTVSNDERLPGRLNVNTASRAALMSVSGMTDEVAGAVVQRRDSEAGAFLSVGELLTSRALDEKVFKAVAERVTVRSNVFEVRSVGKTSRGIRKEIRAVVDRGADPMAVLYWYQSE